MVKTEEALLREIEAFMRLHGIPATEFGKRVCGNPHIVKRLRRGVGITTSTLDKCREYMRKYKPPKTPVKRRKQQAEATV
jgi:hypothetical protein